MDIAATLETNVKTSPGAEQCAIRPATADRPLVFLIVSHGWTVRNYLLSDFLPSLTQRCRVVLCSPLAEDREFRSTFAQRGLRVEPLLHYSKTWLHKRISVRQNLYHLAWCATETMKIKMARGRSWYGPLRNFRNRIEQGIARHIAGPRLLRTLDRLDAWCHLRSPQAEYYSQLLRELQPAVVFSTASVVQDEWIPLYVAQKMGIKTAVAVMSWDNLTSKGRLPCGCDCYVVWTEQMKREALEFHPGIQDEQVIIGGSPQFDYHMNPALRRSREEFCRVLGLDPARKIIVYTGVTPGLMPHEPELVATLLEAVRSGRIAGRPQVLVRPHPVDDGKRYRGFCERYPEAVLVIPGEKAEGDVRRLVSSIDDVRLLINTLLHGDVFLNVASTMTIDAAVLDRPVINLRFHLHPPGVPPPLGLEVYEYTHYRPVVASGGVRIAHSLDELVEHVNAYLSDPSLDRDGRRRMVEQICGPLDGRAGQRIANLIADFAFDHSQSVVSSLGVLSRSEAQ